jgi:Flp pilus assembly protein TadG
LKATVDRSRKVDDGTYSADVAKGTETTLPTALMIANSFVVRVESQLGYTPVIAWAADSKNMLGLAAAFDNISMGETYYLRPRMTSTISCSDCYK